MQKLDLPFEDRPLSGTEYLQPTAPPAPTPQRMSEPPAYNESVQLSQCLPPTPPPRHAPPPVPSLNPFGDPNEDDQHYQVPTPVVRKVPELEKRRLVDEDDLEMEQKVEKEESSINKAIKTTLKGLGSKDFLEIRLKAIKGRLGIGRSKKYQIYCTSGGHFAKAYTEPRSCDCLVSIMTLGCLHRPSRISLQDSVENETIYFQRPLNCSNVGQSLGVYLNDGDRMVGQVVRQGIKPMFIAYDDKGEEVFRTQGPLYTMFVKRGKMKFIASRSQDGKDINVGLTRSGKKSCHISFGLGAKYDRLTKILFLANAFLIEFLYYRHGVSV